MDDLFNDAPSVQVRSSRLPAKEILPFQPAYRQQADQEPSLFQLEDLDNLLTETPSVPPAPLEGRTPEGGVESSETSGNSLSASPPANPNTTFNMGLDNVGLDEAFESLLGKSTPLQPSTPSEQAKEKKKAL
ncbi:MAG: hypothetical protein DCF22_14290 [Leptolyngbya sp.]|nr:MAG: hypothetical protein DCF22_14290 [Leptolyngbya sp.]